MVELTVSKSNEIKNIIRNFLNSQLAENPEQISCHLNNDMLAVYAHGIISPAEKAIMHSQNDKRTLFEYKIAEFEMIKTDLIKIIKKSLGCDINKIYTTITDDGIRIIHIRLFN
ncbi:MAG: DUF2294 family protein [Calditrichaceae bacterium]|nr:DUF2294 family protein [Calditrichaceae bacterium]